MKNKEKKDAGTAATKEVSWNAAEHEYVEKDAMWYIAIGAISLVLFFIALWQANYFFAFFVIIAALILANFGKRRPKVFEFRVSEEGIGIGEKFFEFEQLESFMIRERRGALHELIVKQKTYVNPYLRIPVDGGTATRVRALLTTKLPEEDYEVSLLDLFADWFGI